jgi:alpha-ketoglutarate-dependent taurine dioxygenase
MLAGARDVFGPRIFVHQSPATVATGTIPDPCVALRLHIDGCLEFGDYYPDLVFVLCERWATAGGEWYLVDGQRLIDVIAGDLTQRALNRFLWDVKLEQGRPDGVRPSGSGKVVSSRRPIASRTCGGRLTVRRHPHQRLLDNALPGPDDRQYLAAWAKLTEQAARAAPRFLLRPGELLCLDNYRVFHGCEPYTGYDRIQHMLWAWSDMAFGLPYPKDLATPPANIITGPSR